MLQRNLLEEFTDYDIKELDRLLERYENAVRKLSELRKLKRQTKKDKDNIIHLPTDLKDYHREYKQTLKELNKISEELDFLFFEDN
jgi:chromosome segregation ATPase